MKHIALFALVFAIVSLVTPVATLAGGRDSATARPAEIAPPVVDVFEEGDFCLRLIAMPSADLASTQVTLIYEDRALRTMRSVTVNPNVAATSADPKFLAFLDSMDDDFVSFVRATLADRLLHLSAAVSVLDRAESAIFFRTNDLDTRVGRRASATETATE